MLVVAWRMRSTPEEDSLVDWAATSLPPSSSMCRRGDPGCSATVATVIAEPVWVANHSVEVSASMGYTLYPQGEEIDGDQLLRQADQAMYRAKREGKNRYCCFQDADA